MDGLFYSLKTLLGDKLRRKTKGRSDEEKEIACDICQHGMDVPSAETFHWFTAIGVTVRKEGHGVRGYIQWCEERKDQ